MPKIRLRQAVCFDGETFPAGHVFDTNKSPISAECLIQREWGDEVSDDTEPSVVPVPPVVLVPSKDDQHDEPAVEPTAPPVASPAPVVEPPKKPRKK